MISCLSSILTNAVFPHHTERRRSDLDSHTGRKRATAGMSRPREQPIYRSRLLLPVYALR